MSVKQMVDSLDERIEGQTGSLFSGILSMLDSHHKTLESLERELRMEVMRSEHQ